MHWHAELPLEFNVTVRAIPSGQFPPQSSWITQFSPAHTTITPGSPTVCDTIAATIISTEACVLHVTENPLDADAVTSVYAPGAGLNTFIPVQKLAHSLSHPAPPTHEMDTESTWASTSTYMHKSTANIARIRAMVAENATNTHMARYSRMIYSNMNLLILSIKFRSATIESDQIVCIVTHA